MLHDHYIWMPQMFKHRHVQTSAQPIFEQALPTNMYAGSFKSTNDFLPFYDNTYEQTTWLFFNKLVKQQILGCLNNKLPWGSEQLTIINTKESHPFNRITFYPNRALKSISLSLFTKCLSQVTTSWPPSESKDYPSHLHHTIIVIFLH